MVYTVHHAPMVHKIANGTEHMQMLIIQFLMDSNNYIGYKFH